MPGSHEIVHARAILPAKSEGRADLRIRQRLAAADLLQKLLRQGLSGGRPPRLERAPGGGWLAADDFGPLAVSVGHSGRFIGAIASREGPLGIDLERVDSRRAWRELAHFCLGPAEAARVTAEGIGCFYRFWTLKEAIGKAAGLGLGLLLERRDHLPDIDFEKPWTCRLAGRDWWLHSAIVEDDGLAVALAGPSGDFREIRLAQP